MRPYYSDALCTIYHADALDVAAFTNGTVVSDPPYNIGYHYNAPTDRRSESDYNALLDGAFRTPSVIVAYPEVVFRLSLVKGLVPSRVAAWVYNANTPRQHRLVAWFGTEGHPERVPQDYQNPTDKRVAARMAEGHKARGYDWKHFPQVKNVSADKTAHPCQNPVEVMDWVLRATDADCIVDPFMGSGTTLLAAKRLGIRCVGCDIDEGYCEIAARRLSQEVLCL